LNWRLSRSCGGWDGASPNQHKHALPVLSKDRGQIKNGRRFAFPCAAADDVTVFSFGSFCENMMFVRTRGRLPHGLSRPSSSNEPTFCGMTRGRRLQRAFDVINRFHACVEYSMKNARPHRQPDDEIQRDIDHLVRRTGRSPAPPDRSLRQCVFWNFGINFLLNDTQRQALAD